MLGLTRKDWLALLPVLLLFALISTFRSGASGLIDPDEPFYALTAKEMLTRGEWTTPTMFGRPQFEKPVFAYWVFALMFKLFGVHEWSARLGPTLAALGVLVATAVLGKALFRRSRTVFWSVVLLASSGLFITLSRVVLTDMFLCLFTTASFAAFAYGWKHKHARPVAWRLFFAFMALAVLTKGPLGALLPIGSALLYARVSGGAFRANELPWKSGLLIFAAIAAPWYVFEASRHDWFLSHFFLHENVRRFFVAEHKKLNSPAFYPLTLLFGFFPWSFFLVSGLVSQFGRLGRGFAPWKQSRTFLMVSCGAMFLFFACASSKLISYIFPLFPLLAVLVAEWLDRLIPAMARRGSIPTLLRRAQFAGWIIAPSSLIGGVLWYGIEHDLPLSWHIVGAGLLCAGPCAAGYFLFRRGRVEAALAAAAGMAVIFSAAAFGWILPLAEPYFSSRPMIEDFKRDGLDPSLGTLLGSKMSVRGVSYYSGNPNVAVVSGNPKAFYTKHPIPMITKSEDIDHIDADHYPVYGILRPKEIKHLREILDSAHYGLTVIDSNPERAFVRLERRKF